MSFPQLVFKINSGNRPSARRRNRNRPPLHKREIPRYRRLVTMILLTGTILNPSKGNHRAGHRIRVFVKVLGRLRDRGD